MINLHNYMLAIGIGNITFALLLIAYLRGATDAPGLRTWTLARLVFGFTQLLGWSRPGLGVPLLALVEASGWVAGLALETAAYASFFGFAQVRRYLAPVSLISIMLLWATPMAGLTYEGLVNYVSILIGGGALVTGILLLLPRQPQATPLQRLIGYTDLLCGAALVFFALQALAGFTVPDWGVRIGYIAGYLLLIVNGFGFILMSKQRDDARMERLATTDDLTGLLNRRAFFARAEAARLLALRQQQPIALLMIDIDHFKQLNDRFGHATGDEALIAFAATCSATLREHDILGRLGGEEFALALPGTELEGALRVAERVRQGVFDTRLLTCGNHYTMTVSLGLVLLEPDESLAAALARADNALYCAKANGRNRVEVGMAARLRA